MRQGRGRSPVVAPAALSGLLVLALLGVLAFAGPFGGRAGGPSAKDTGANPVGSASGSGAGRGSGTDVVSGVVAPTILGPFVHAFPDASTAGVLDGVVLTTAEHDPARWELEHSIENVTYRGSIVVRAADVTIRNVRVELDGEGIAIWNPDGWPGLRIEHVEVVCQGEQRGQAAIAGSHMVVRSVDVSGCVDGLKVGARSTVALSYIHDLAFGPSSHNDGIQIGDGEDITVIGNTIVQPDNGQRRANAAVFVQDTYAAVHRVRVVGNYVDGFGFTLRLSGARITDSELSANVIGPSHLFGPYLLDRGAEQPGQANTVLANVRPDGTPIP